MRPRPVAVAVGIILLALTMAAPGRAMSVVPPTFSELVDEATQIARVEVTAVSSRWDEAPGGSRVIHTYVKCQLLKVMKGDAQQDTIALRLLGGEVDGLRLEVADMPAFQVGEKCLLFITQNGTAVCPLVGAMHGCYRLVTDQATGVEHVLRNNREPLSDVAGVVRPMADQPAAARANAVASALTTADFENAIIQQLGAAKDK